MDDVRRQDVKIFVKTALEPFRVFSLICGAFLIWFFPVFDRGFGMPKAIMIAGILAIWMIASYYASVERRFLSRRMKALWIECRDRLARFHEVLRKMRKEQVADLREVPKTIDATGEAVYFALRRADLIAHEVMDSERGLYNTPRVAPPPHPDAQSNELYRIADKNIAEYRQQFAGVMAGVQRAEAQAAVFMTTVDNLRMKMLGYRLVGKSPELSSYDFLEALAEAKLQLASIDKALDELDLGLYPKTIAIEGQSSSTELEQGN